MQGRYHALLAACLAMTVLSAAYGQAPPKDSRRTRQVAVTFDDLPATSGDSEKMASVTERLLKHLRDHSVPAVGFVNESKLFVDGKEVAARTALLEKWLDAGLELGNHTYSHVSIDSVPFEAYREDLIRGEVVTRRLLAWRGMKLRYFRHPQLRSGPTPEYKAALDRLLARRGYTVAPVTIDNNDFIFAAVYTRARARGDTVQMAKIVSAYLSYMDQVFAHFERVSTEFLGYEVRQTLLLHANELNADCFDALARMMRGRGYRFISLGEALKDRAYRLPEAQAKRGLSWLHRWMMAKGQKVQPEPEEPPFIRELFQASRQP